MIARFLLGVLLQGVLAAHIWCSGFINDSKTSERLESILQLQHGITNQPPDVEHTDENGDKIASIIA